MSDLPEPTDVPPLVRPPNPDIPAEPVVLPRPPALPEREAA